MPKGVIINTLSIFIGGLIGSFAGQWLSDDFKQKMNMIFGACAMTMGISSIRLMKNMPAVVFSVVIGTALGSAIHFGGMIEKMCGAMQRAIGKILHTEQTGDDAQARQAELLTVIVLFCASGTGIYGAIVEGMSGDASILISKSILDFFTALIFSCTLGMVVAFIAAPSFAVFITLFLLGGVIFPYTTPDMINDFKAVGGVLLLATGFRMIQVKMFPTADMIPAMILAMPVSWLWTNVIMPLL